MGDELVRIPVAATGPNPTLHVTSGLIETVVTVGGVSVENLMNSVFDTIARELLDKVQLAPPATLQCLGTDLSRFAPAAATAVTP